MTKNVVLLVCLGVLMFGAVGCKTTVDDRWRADMTAKILPATFKPTYEVMKDKGIVKGTAESTTWFWFFTTEPDTYANELTGHHSMGLKIGNSIASAALYNACENAGANIILAPRFIQTQEVGFLGFTRTLRVTCEGIPARLTGAEEIPFDKLPPPCPYCCR